MSKISLPLEEMDETCESIASVNVGETHKLASKLWDLSINYFKDVRRQAQQSFTLLWELLSWGRSFSSWRSI